MRRLSSRLALCLGVALLGLASAARGIEIPKQPSARPRLKSIYSVEHDLRELKLQGTKGIAFVFLDCDCPVALQYVPTLKELYEEFRREGIAFYGIYPNARVDVLKMAVNAHDQDLPFPVFLDRGQKLAKLLEISVTPEVAVLDEQWNVVYQGAIDDQFTKSGKRPQALRHYLRDALAAYVAGREADPAYTVPSGCPLEPETTQVATKEQVTYHKDVAPIILENCTACHRKGGVGPFTLENYNDAFYSCERIKEVVQERRMPPWHGFLNPEFGKLKNAKVLTDEQIATIAAWVDQGCEEGDPKDAPPPKTWPDPNAWDIGKPDYIYYIPKPFTVPKSGILDYQFFRVKLRFPEDRWFNAVQVKPGNPEVVHHIGLHVVPADDRAFSGFAGMTALYGFNGESGVLINDYVPGDTYNAVVYPEGQAVRIPKNSDLIFEIHYQPNNKAPTTDQSMVAFKWADQAPKEEVHTKVFRKPIGRFRIAPHDHHATMEDTYYFKEDIYLDAVRPHFHYRGKSFRLEIIERDPETDEITSRKSIITVPIFNEGWQRTYELETPLLIKAGTELLAVGHFDNSIFNPRNPDPNQTVLWGQQTKDEMFSTRFKFRLAKEVRP